MLMSKRNFLAVNKLDDSSTSAEVNTMDQSVDDSLFNSETAFNGDRGRTQKNSGRASSARVSRVIVQFNPEPVQMLWEQVLSLLWSFCWQKSWVHVEHHSHVFMFQVVTVEHKAANPCSELHEHLDFIT